MVFVALLLLGFLGHLRFLTHDCPVDLSGDEAQYWDWSRRLDWSYYSKGPLVAWVIRASCAGFGRDTMLAVRFPALLLAGGASGLTYLLTRKLFGSDRVALGAVLLYYIIPMFAAGSLLMTIDPPFFFCWGLATYLAAIAVFDDRRRAWPAAGIAAGVGFLSKYTMLLWFVPVLLFLLSDPASRKHLRSAGPWLAIGVALLFTTPVMFWNAGHGWVSVRHVATDTGADETGRFSAGNLAAFVVGQVAIVGPGVVVMMAAAVGYALRSAPRTAEASRVEPFSRQMRFLAWIGLSLLGFTLLASLRTKAQLNWPVPAYFTLIILTAWFLATRLRGPEMVKTDFDGVDPFPSPGTAPKMKWTAMAVALSEAKGLFCRGRKRSFAALRMTSTYVLGVGDFHPSWVSRRPMAAPGEAAPQPAQPRWRAWRWWFHASVVGGMMLVPLAHDPQLLYPLVVWLNSKTVSARAARANPALAPVGGVFGLVGRLLPAKGLDGRRVDFTAKLKGWRELGDVVSDERDRLGPDAFVLCSDYQETAEMAFYVRGQPVTYYLGSYFRRSPKRLTQYDAWEDRSLEPGSGPAGRNPLIGRNAIFVGQFDKAPPELIEAFENVFDPPGHNAGDPAARRAMQLNVVRAGLQVQSFRLIRCYGFRGLRRPVGRPAF